MTSFATDVTAVLRPGRGNMSSRHRAGAAPGAAWTPSGC
eukprot:CAMPEP_0119063560 /NCGR_PEP_ID=MMETSP1178-20130426/6869_1 /TAXON_ID=33656 /ORGANISM="unid sp, Strain CCMP2000" /LENGTH=38 /DNA_ID= /DNA_START= /DNA_END= /DNA_ORIENTATION=